ncbi:MAG: hypothetical protein COT74_09885 [Bdellovibrionales bacterium CG10_big_fil_rev_8_21_14_0_10_45_34]|nr:MAG: hypothetical protein COT74_09885 [Bdellovibrionales bacterium CG10_big_fil_rev_8_21_14_0_10_45_34]
MNQLKVALFVLGLCFVSNRASSNLLSADSMQLRQLVLQTREQIELLKQSLETSKLSSSQLDGIDRSLGRLSSGVDRSLEKVQGTALYEKAMLEVQSNNSFKNTFTEAKQLKEVIDADPRGRDDEAQMKTGDFINFQKSGVLANQDDLARQKMLEQALNSAEPGFVPKVIAESQIGNWRANVRVSSQLIQMLATMQAIREELRLLRTQSARSGGSAIFEGASRQNELQKERREK